MGLIAHAHGKVIIPTTGEVLDFGVDFPFFDEELEKLARLSKELNALMSISYTSTAVATAIVACVTATAAYMGINSSLNTAGATEIPYNSASGYTQTTRPAIAWAAYSSPGQVSNDTQTYTMGASWTPAAIPFFSLWTASTAGTFLTGGATSGLSGNIPAGANVTFTNAVTLAYAD